MALKANYATEAQEQEKLIRWLQIKKIFHWANVQENQGSFLNRKVAMIQAVKAKKMGKMRGLPDVTVMLPDKMLFIEMKRAPKILMSGKKSMAGINVSDHQKEFIKRLAAFDYCESRICYGFKEAQDFIQNNIE